MTVWTVLRRGSGWWRISTRWGRWRRWKEHTLTLPVSQRTGRGD